MRIWSKEPVQGILVAYAEPKIKQANFKFQTSFNAELKRNCGETKNFYFGLAMFLKEALGDNVRAERIYIYPAQNDTHKVQIAALGEGGNLETHFNEWWNCAGPKKHVTVLNPEATDFQVKTMDPTLFSSIATSKHSTVVSL